MPQIRVYKDKDGLKMLAKLSAGATLEEAIAAVNWSLEDWHRFQGQEKFLQNGYLQAMRDRSTLLLERTLDIERQLAELDVSASATDVALARLRADILRQVAVAHDSNLTPNQGDKQEETEGLVSMLRRLETEGDRDKANKPFDATGSHTNEPLDVNVNVNKLTH